MTPEEMKEFMNGQIEEMMKHKWIESEKAGHDLGEEANKDYERYLERYCKMYGYTREEAEKHQIVKDVKEYYEKGRV